MKKLLKILGKVVLGILAAFVATFVIYFFNLDMKLMTVVEPLLQKYYDKMPRKQYL